MVIVGAAVGLMVANCRNRSGVVLLALDFWTIALDCLEVTVDHSESVSASFTGTEAAQPMSSIVEGRRSEWGKLE
jgi:hypothetical protein